MEIIAVQKANYIEGYKLEIFFTNEKKRVVDFTQFFNSHTHPQYNKYRKTENFKKFTIENGNIIWGKNWDMIFPVYNLYHGKVN